MTVDNLFFLLGLTVLGLVVLAVTLSWYISELVAVKKRMEWQEIRIRTLIQLVHDHFRPGPEKKEGILLNFPEGDEKDEG